MKQLMQLQGRQLWRANSLLVFVAGVFFFRGFFLGLVELAKEFGFNVEEECSDKEDAESSSINKVVVLVRIG